MDVPDLLSIGDFARASGLTSKALRLYDEMGLLLPTEVDDVTGYRWYGEHQLVRARLVARLRLVGMPLARIRRVADLGPGPAAVELTSYWRQVEADTASARALLTDVLATLEETDMTIIDTIIDTTHPEAAVRTGIGARASQEDEVRTGGGLYVVADGVGALRGVARVALDALTDPPPGADPLAFLDAGLTRAAQAVARHYADEPQAASTLTAVLLLPGRVVSAHVGDSRVYLVRDGSLTRLTRDHTVVQTLIDEGRLTAEEARTDDRRVILNRAVAAGAPYAPDLAIHATMPGDRLVLTTDGVHGQIDPAALADLLTAEAGAEAVAETVARAVEDAGAPDNYAVLVIDLA